MNNFSRIFLAVIILCSLNSWANPELKTAFKKSFITGYTEGECGNNILNFLQRSDNQRINLGGANIIQIENKGFSLFGLINAEFARSSGRLNPSYPGSGLRNLPGENNWYHHVILEQDGLIYDFDFGNEANVSTVQSYFEKMFLDEKTGSNGGKDYIGRKEKLKSYEIKISPGLETLEARRNRKASPPGEIMRLGEYLRIHF